jgi:hypothetical protein
MAVSKRGGLPQDLARVQNQFQAWCRQRQAGGRIPHRLWALAVRLVSQHGLDRTATALGLDFYSLKIRVEAAGQHPPSPGPAFVELPAPLLASKQALFELDNGAGATMPMQLLGYDAADVEALARRFWGAQ